MTRATEVIEPEQVLEGPLSPEDRKVFVIQRATLLVAFIGLISLFGWSVGRLVSLEPDALREGRNLVARRVEGNSVAVNGIHDAFMKILAEQGRAALADSGGQVTPDSATRMSNLEGLYQLSRGIREGVKYDVPAAKDIKPLTVFVSPLTGKAIPLNATEDGRVDEAAFQQVLGRQQDVATLMALVRMRAEQQSPKDMSLALLAQAKANAAQGSMNGGGR